jgi:DNA-binding NtrC family response regulator
MIERIKEQLWKILRDKKISLAMIYTDDGEILWHRGREIKGKYLSECVDICKSTALQSIEKQKKIKKENCLVTLNPSPLTESALLLNIKSLLIIPMAEKYFLYLDSGISEGFGEREIGAFETMAIILSEIFKTLIRGQESTVGKKSAYSYLQKFNEKVIRYAIEEEPVLLLGRTGVGKNRAGEMIHRYSGRKGNFVVAHCPTIPESLFESEIFGHKKGSFTGADTDRKGLLGQAELGTLFIDEISDVPLSFQSKLLRFIENKTYKVLGETQERRTNVRIIAASNHDLPEEIQKGHFRDDLYFRLNSLSINIPPLKEHKEDIKVLVEEYRNCLRGKEINPKGWEVLLNYDWPGNIRELITVLKRVGIDSPGMIIGSEITQIIKETGFVRIGNNTTPGSSEHISRVWQNLEMGKSFWDVVWKPFIAAREFNRQEVYGIIKEAYSRAGGNLKGSIKVLGINSSEYSKFITYLHKYKIHPSR